MKQFLILLRVRFISQLRLNALKGKTSIGDKMIIFGIFLALVFGIVYSTGLGFMLNEYDMREYILAYSFLFSTVISLFLALFTASDEFFGRRDYDFLMSLPINTSIIVVSRFFYIYLLNTIVSIIFMLPMGVVYFFTGTVDSLFWIKVLLGIFTVALIPSIVASIISIFVLEISSRMKYSRAATSIIYIGIVLALVLIPTFSSYKLEQSDMKLILTNLFSKFNDLYPIFNLYNKFLLSGKWIDFLIYIIVSLLITMIFIISFSIVFKGLNTRIQSISSDKKYEVKTLKSSSHLKALYVKELKRLISSSMYLLNKAVAGMIFMIIFAIMIALDGINSMTEVLGEMSLDHHTIELMYGLTPYILAGLVFLSNTSSVAFSLEGKNIWIIKTLPISKENVVKSKVLVNLTVTIPFTIISGIIIAISIGSSLFDSIILVLLPSVFAIFSAIYGIAVNLRFPNYNWQSENQVIQRSVASMLSIGGIFLVLILAIPRVYWPDSMVWIYDIVIILCVSIVTSMLYNKIIKNESI